MAIDLHTHSSASDGSEPPERLVELALEAGLTALAVTDHDTLGGIEAARKAAEGTDLEVISGTELSLQYHTGGMHLLVLWLEPGAGPLQDRLDTLQGGRIERNQRIAERLTELDMPVTLEEIEEEAGSGSVGRPHIAAVMVRKGYVESNAEAFDLWLGSGMPAYFSRPRLEAEEAIGLAIESGAVPILAHPHTLNIDRAHEMAEMLNRLCGAGLLGLEAVYSTYRPHERYGYTDLARRFDLLPTGGSDYHGSYKPGLELGTGYGDLSVTDEILDDLKKRLGTQ
jgi:predicted metal-dependent phosphoesterase TrpH